MIGEQGKAFYRYMIDAAAMDFDAVTDHFAGGGHEYWWWLTEKSCDLYHLPRTFTTFYGYERSARFPNGHRNIFHTRRGVPMVRYFSETGYVGEEPFSAARDVVENDTKLLENQRLAGHRPQPPEGEYLVLPFLSAGVLRPLESGR